MVVSSKWTLPRFVSFLELALLPSKPLLPRCDTFGFFKEPFLGNKGGDLLPLLLLALLCDCEILRVVALNNSRFLLRRVLGETLELYWRYPLQPWYSEKSRQRILKNFNITETERIEQNRLRYQQTKNHKIWQYRNAHIKNFASSEAWKEEDKKYQKCQEQFCWCIYDFEIDSKSHKFD